MHEALRREVVEAAKKKGFTGLTEIQLKAIPAIAIGKDVLVLAPTGYGKTETCLLPILSKLVEAKDVGDLAGIQALYVSPLRALNRDLLARLSFWCNELGITLGVRHGDTPASERRKQRDNPPMLMISTPETLGSMLVAPKLKDSLANIRYVVVDEVHELASSKRGLQLSLALERLREKSGAFQTIGLSATVGNADEVAAFLSPRAKTVSLETLRQMDVFVEFPSEAGAEEVSAKAALISKLIQEHKKTLLFVNTRSFAEGLGSLLMRLPELKDKVAVHHSSLSREARVDTEERFKSGRLKAIVCTSSLELGIDVGDVDLVVQYVSPRQVSRFVQRVGRSGHRKHLVPKGALAAVDAVDAAECAVIARKARKHEIEPVEIRENALDVLAHGIAGLALDFASLPADKAFEVVKRAYPYRSISRAEFDSVVNQLSAQRTVSFRDGVVSKRLRTLLYYYDNLSTIPDEKQFFVVDAATRKHVGILHEEFASSLSPGSVFIARGRPWKVLDVHENEFVVERSDDVAAAVPEWEGEQIPVPRAVAEETGDLLVLLLNTSNSELKRTFSLSEEAANKLRAFAYKQKTFFIPSKNILVVEPFERFIVLHSFAGSKANETLANALSSLLTSSLGSSVRARPSPYAIAFEFAKPFPTEKFVQALKELGPADLRKIVSTVLPRTALFRYRFLHVARRFGFVSRDADLRQSMVQRLADSQKGSPVWREALEELLHDKFALQEAEELAERVSAGKCHVQVHDAARKGLSPLAKDFLEFAGYGELFAPPEPTAQIIQVFKDGLLSKQARLACTHCAKTFSSKVSELGDSVKCPYCSSSQVTLARYEAVLAKKAGRRALSAIERRQYAEALRVASLVSSYGRKAVAAMETYGVGPEAAARVLRKLQKSDEELYRDLLEAQKTFVRTRKYWRA
ncbi:MAG: DEAD/DEAH box helicase [Candidatus Micrarchaeota archaeon]